MIYYSIILISVSNIWFLPYFYDPILEVISEFYDIHKNEDSH